MLHSSKKLRRTATAVVFALLVVGATSLGLHSKQHTAAASAGATVTKESWVDSRTLDLTVSSQSVDSWDKTKKVRLILPDGWTKDTAKTYPTLWLLHGGMDDYTSWSKKTDIAKLAAGHDVMVVMPDTSWCSAYSDWWNYGKGGSPAWETYLTQELPQILQSKYHSNGLQATAGVSMGGLGALKLPANHTDQYVAAASFSGNVDTLHSYDNTADGPDLPGLSCGSDWKRVWGDYKIPEQKAIWQRNNPYDQADKLASLKYLYVSSGSGQADPLHTSWFGQDSVEQQVNVENQELVKKLHSLNVPVTSHFYDGRHDWPYWNQELHTAFPGLLQALGTN